MQRSNKAAQILTFQTQEIKKLKAQGLIDRFQHIDLQSFITELYNQQGASERIKNFPYPRQFATLNLFYIRIFTFLLPFGMLNQFEEILGENFVWFTIPFAVLVGWIFTTLEKVGETSENPFEGSANDTPITQISKNIEIDLLEMINVSHELKPKQPVFGVLS
jgi:putative membrane protein